MALTRYARHRAPIDGSFFTTTGNLDSILRNRLNYNEKGNWPAWAQDARVPVYVRMVKYKASVTKLNPDGMIFGPVVRVGTMDSPDVELFGHHHAAGLFEDYKLDWSDRNDRWIYTPHGYGDTTPPGEDVSVYRCSICNENSYRDNLGDRMHNSACLQNGSLVCRDCEYIGLVADGEAKDQLSRCRKLASFLGGDHLDRFERNIEHLSRGFSFGHPSHTRLHREDKFSFAWTNVVFTPEGRKRGMNGGLIQHGPRVETNGDGDYVFSMWDYKAPASRAATPEEVDGIHWSIHT